MRRFLSRCKSLWCVLFHRGVPCFTVIDCWVSLLHIVDDQSIIWFWLMIRCEFGRRETRAIFYRAPAVIKTQNILRNSSWTLFIPPSSYISNSSQVTVHGDCLSFPQRHNRRLLCHHRHTTHTWKQQDDTESRETHRLMNPTWGQSCSKSASLHVRAVMRVQRVPSMLSVCAENGLVTWKVSLLLTDQRVWRMRRGGAGGAI